MTTPAAEPRLPVGPVQCGTLVARWFELAMVIFHACRDVALPPATTWQAFGATAVVLRQGPAGEWIESLAP